MAKIFVSYRRSDSADTVGRICDRLTRVLGEENVFKDVDSIAYGAEWATVIDRQLDQCDAVLVVIGKNWTTVRTPEGVLRLNDPEDTLRREVEKALARRMFIIPVLIGSANMPTEKQLPKSIRDLVKRNALHVRPDPDFKRDIAQLIQTLKKAAPWDHDPKSDGYARLPCLHCGKSLKLLPTQGGKRVRCPHCSALLVADKTCSSLAEPPAPAPIKRTPKKPVTPDIDDEVEPSREHSPRRKSGCVGTLLWLFLLALVLSGAGGSAAWYFYTKPEVHHITGTIHIAYKSREMKEGDKKAADVYAVNLDAKGPSKKVNYSGKIFRNVTKEGEDTKTENLDFQLEVEEFPLNLIGRPNADERTLLGSIKGIVPVDKDGLYEFEKLKWVPNNSGAPISFGGKVQGKKGEDEAKRETVNYGQGNVIEIGKADPLGFKSLELPGQSGVRKTTIRGDLVFDYQSDRYFTSGLTFSYADRTDSVLGTIFWRKLDGYPNDNTKYGRVKDAKSRYDFTLIFNDKVGAAGGRAGEKVKAADAPSLEINSSMSTLKGTIDYVDDGYWEKNKKKGENELRPMESTVTFDLKSNRLDADQVHNFLKMWLLMSGPVNDE